MSDSAPTPEERRLWASLSDDARAAFRVMADAVGDTGSHITTETLATSLGWTMRRVNHAMCELALAGLIGSAGVVDTIRA